MPETRRLSTRTKSERQPKRKTRSPIPVARVKKRTPSPEIEIEEPLPSTLKDDQALPTRKEHNDINIANKDYKSVAESGVLKTATDRSRQKLLTDGFFEKYWIKPSKKNAVDASNPSKETMQKIGSTTLTIEPHSFEVVIYKVKGPPQQVTFLPPQQAAHGLAPNSQGSPHTTSISGDKPQGPAITTPLSQSPRVSKPGYTTRPAPTSSESAISATPKAYTSATPQATQNQPSGTTKEPQSIATDIPAQDDNSQHVRPPAPANSNNEVNRSNQPQSSASSNQAPSQDSSGIDPVIQMLAARAAEDEDLKSLMRVVAQGQANQEQLGIFQKHIDELNAIINERKKQTTNSSSSQPLKPPPPSTSPVPRASIPAPVMAPTPRAIHPASFTPIKQDRQVPYYSPQYFHPTKIQAKPTSNKQVEKSHIAAVVFEFVEAPSTRYILPKASIVEYRSSTDSDMAVMSFIVTRKGTNSYGGKYDEKKEYYQPITIKLQPLVGSLRQDINSATMREEEARRSMMEVMQRSEIAESSYLAIRLRYIDSSHSRIGDNTHAESALVSTDVPSEHYEAPNSLLSISDLHLIK